jgi:hypothetical protein
MDKIERIEVPAEDRERLRRRARDRNAPQKLVWRARIELLAGECIFKCAQQPELAIDRGAVRSRRRDPCRKPARSVASWRAWRGESFYDGEASLSMIGPLKCNGFFEVGQRLQRVGLSGLPARVVAFSLGGAAACTMSLVGGDLLYWLRVFPITRTCL